MMRRPQSCGQVVGVRRVRRGSGLRPQRRTEHRPSRVRDARPEGGEKPRLFRRGGITIERALVRKRSMAGIVRVLHPTRGLRTSAGTTLAVRSGQVGRVDLHRESGELFP